MLGYFFQPSRITLLRGRISALVLKTEVGGQRKPYDVMGNGDGFYGKKM